MNEVFNRKHGGLLLRARASETKLSIRLAGSLTGRSEPDEVNEVDLVDKMLHLNPTAHYETAYLDIADLHYVDTYGVGALCEIMRRAGKMVIIGLGRGLRHCDLSVITWLATQGECIERLGEDDDLLRAA